MLLKSGSVTLICCNCQDILVITAKANKGWARKVRKEGFSLQKVFSAMFFRSLS